MWIYKFGQSKGKKEKEWPLLGNIILKNKIEKEKR